MKIKVYQINMDRDEKRIAFESLDRLKSQNLAIDSSIYDTVFDGEVDGDTLEDVFRIFNIERPEGYRGRSLSVSDIVEVVEPPRVVGTIETTSAPFLPISLRTTQPMLPSRKCFVTRIVTLSPAIVLTAIFTPWSAAVITVTVWGSKK